MKIIVRTDASTELGSGHVMRCLALADALRERGAAVVFVCRSTAGDLCDLVAASGYAVHRLATASTADWREDAARTAAIARQEGPIRWVIVDHYALESGWESELRAHSGGVMVIDDLANRTHDCDVLLDQNFFPDGARRYEGIVPPACTLLLGPRFALLRREFAAARPSEPREAVNVRRVFVFLSGVDPGNATGRVLDALDQVAGPDVEADIAVGQGGQHIEQLQRYCAAKVGRRLHVQSARIAHLLAQSDLAIGAGGASSWERACLGVPSLVLGLAENQIPIAQALARHGAHLFLGSIETLDDAALQDALRVLLANGPLRTALSRTSFTITDGRGTGRVARQLLDLQVSVRLADAADCEKIFVWRNAPATRRHFFDSSPLDPGVHRKWFAEALRDNSRVLLIGAAAAQELGVLRYDLRGNEARVSIYLDPKRHGEGHGSALLRAGARWLQTQRPEIHSIVAEVLCANEASQRAFLAAGFQESHLCLRLDLGGKRSDDSSASNDSTVRT